MARKAVAELNKINFHTACGHDHPRSSHKEATGQLHGHKRLWDTKMGVLHAHTDSGIETKQHHSVATRQHHASICPPLSASARVRAV